MYYRDVHNSLFYVIIYHQNSFNHMKINFNLKTTSQYIH